MAKVVRITLNAPRRKAGRPRDPDKFVRGKAPMLPKHLAIWYDALPQAEIRRVLEQAHRAVVEDLV